MVELKLAIALVPLAFGLCGEGERDQPRLSATREIESRQRYGPRGIEHGARTGTEKILVVLVEFGGPDQFTFTPSGANASTWDPIGKADSTEWTGKVGDCSEIVKKFNITGPKEFIFTGPLHNTIERPRSFADDSGDSVWTEDFSREYYEQMIFGAGPHYRYSRQDGSPVDNHLAGWTVRDYFRDMSLGQLDITGEVLGWVKVPHSVFYYGADPCPGRRSGSSSTQSEGAIPGAGNKQRLYADVVEALKTSYPGYDWKKFDANGDGILDHLWIVFAGVDEADSSTLLNRTAYGEGTLWSSSGSISARLEIAPGLRVDHAIIMGEATGAAVFVHEFGHALGAIDEYSYGEGDTSAGVWTVMSDDWIGFPITAQPQAMDPLHLDQWGWLNPFVIQDPSREYIVTLGRASNFPRQDNVYRGARIHLPPGDAPLPVMPVGNWQWWSTARPTGAARMTLRNPVTVPAGGLLQFDAAYYTESQWDFLFVQISTDGGQNWQTLTNEHTTCRTENGWHGSYYGFPNDLCAAGLGGFTGRSAGYPNRVTEKFDLSALSGRAILIRLTYITDTTVYFDGVFLDQIRLSTPLSNLWLDDAEAGGDQWAYTGGFGRYGRTYPFNHSYYLQWRDNGPEGGFDRGLGNRDWRFGPTDSGLLVWYFNERYTDNESQKYLADPPSFGPKGRIMVVDAHPEPLRDPERVARGFENEAANVSGRGQMRDAPFNLEPTLPFWMDYSLPRPTYFASRPGIPIFSDALGYYAGARRTRLGPGHSNPSWGWVMEDWDGSVVIPSRVDYPMRAPGLRDGDKLEWSCSTSGDNLKCSPLAGVAAPKTGGTGNPGDAGGQYGWNVEILSQSPAQATVRIWNQAQRDMPPRVLVTAPAPFATLMGRFDVVVEAADDKGVREVACFLNGQPRGTMSTAPYRLNWDTAAERNGPHEFACRACDSAGQCSWDTQRYTIGNASAPIVTITAPSAGAVVGGTVEIAAAITGAASARVELLVDGLAVATFPANLRTALDTAALTAGTHTITVRATAGGRAGEAELSVIVAARSGAPALAGLLNAASFQNRPLAPGAIFSLFGQKLARETMVAAGAQLPEALAGTALVFRDANGPLPAGLFFVSSGQVNFEVPMKIAPGAAELTVTSAAGKASIPVYIDRVSPSLFSANLTGSGLAAAIVLRVNPDGSRATQFVSDGAVRWSEQLYLLLYGTGIRSFAKVVTARVGGIEVPVLGALAQGQYVGLDQVNIGPLPAALAGRGEVPIQIWVDGVAANPVTIRMQ